MAPQPPLLQIALRERHLLRYGMFRAEYDRAARQIDPALVGSAPSRAQFHRWVSGGLKRVPYINHCRVLEVMLPEWTADQLFAPCPPGVLIPAPTPSEGSDLEPRADRLSITGFADVTAIYPTRGEFTYAMPPHSLFDGAQEIRAAGLSLNLICQQYPDQRLHQMIVNGTLLHCLFLDPEGTSISAREKEEGYQDRHLTTLTRLNIEVLTRLRDRLPVGARDRLKIAVYDEAIRFNLTFINNETCIMQPYLPQARGVDSPTFVIERETVPTGLYGTFDQVFTSLADRSRPV